MNSLVDNLHRGNINLYASIRHNVDQLFVAVRKRLKWLFDFEEKELQQSVYGALHYPAGVVQKSFVNATELVIRSLSLIVRH